MCSDNVPGHSLRGARLFVALAIVVSQLTACGGGSGGGGGGGGGTSGTISGIVVKGAVANATVTAYRLDASMVRGSALGTTTTAADGSFTVTVPPYNGALEVVASGGSYIEEAVGNTVQLSRELSFVVASYQAGTTQVMTLSPISSVAVGLARAHVKKGEALGAAYNTAWTHVNGHFGAIDWRTVLPADLTSTSAATLSPESTAGLILAGFSQAALVMAQDASVTPGVVINAATLADAASADSADETLDGYGLQGRLMQASVALDGQTFRRVLGQALLLFVKSPRNGSRLSETDVRTLANTLAANSDPYLFCPNQTPAPECAGGAIDMDAPVITFPSPAAGSGARGSVTVHVQATDASPITSMAFTAPTAISGVTPTFSSDARSATLDVTYDVSSLPDGPITFTVVAQDQFHNSRSSSLGVVVANHGPVISVSSPSASQTLTGSVQVVASATAQTPGATITNLVLLEPAPGTTGMGTDLLPAADTFATTFDTTKAPEGVTRLHFQATDSFGGVTDLFQSVTLDNVPLGSIAVAISVGAPLAGAQVKVLAIDNATGTVNTAVGASGVLGMSSGTGTGGTTDAAGNLTITITTENYSGPIQIIATAPPGGSLTYVDPTNPAQMISVPAGLGLTSYVAHYTSGTTITAPVTYWTTLADVEALAYVKGNHRLYPVTHSLVEALIFGDPLFASHNYALRPVWDVRSVVPFLLTDPPTHSLVDRTYAAFTDVALNYLAKDISVAAGFGTGGVITAPTLVSMFQQDLAADGQFDGKGDAGTVLKTAGATPVTLDANTLRDSLAIALDEFIQSPRNQSGLLRADLDGAGVFTTMANDTSDLFGPLAPIAFDNQGPTTTVTVSYAAGLPPVGGPSGFVGGTVKVTVDANDASGVSSVVVTRGGGALQAAPGNTASHYVGTWDTIATLTPDGALTFTVVAVDAHQNSSTKTVSVVVDNTPPAISVTTPSGSVFYSGTVPFDATATDAGSSVASLVASSEFTNLVDLDSGLPHLFATWAIPAITPDGVVTGALRACDAVGNCSSRATPVMIDRTPPTVAFTTPPPAAVKTGSVTVTITVSDAAGAGIGGVYGRSPGTSGPKTADPVPGSPGTYTVSLNLLAGANTVTVSAVDLAQDATGPKSNSGDGRGTPYEATATVILDASAPAASPDSVLRSYYSESGVTVAVAGSGAPLVPAQYQYASAQKDALPNGASIYKAATRLGWSSQPTAATLETTNADNIPVLRFSVPFDAASQAALTGATYSVATTCAGCSYPAATGPLWPSSVSAAGQLLFILPLSSNLIPSLTSVPGPATLSVTLTLTDAAGNSATSGPFDFTFNVVGPPLVATEDTNWPGSGDRRGTYYYTVAQGRYVGLWDTTSPDFQNGDVRLVRYLVFNPAPVPVALAPGYDQLPDGSWKALETWTAATLPDPCDPTSGVCVWPIPTDNSNMVTFGYFWRYDTNYTWHSVRSPSGTWFTPSSGWPCADSDYGTGGVPRHRWGFGLSLWDRDGGHACYNALSQYVFTNVEKTSGSAAVATNVFTYSQPGGGEITLAPLNAGYATVPAADANGPGRLVIYLSRKVAARDSEAPVMAQMTWTGSVFTGIYETVYPIVHYGSAADASRVDVTRTMTTARETIGGQFRITSAGVTGSTVFGIPTTQTVIAVTKTIPH